MTLFRINLLLILGICLAQSCKKTVDYPAEIRPRDFYVKCTLINNDGQEQPYEYRGEDSLLLFPGAVTQISYLSGSKIQDSLRYIWTGLGLSILPQPFFIQVSHPQPVTNPFTTPEWQQEPSDGF